MAFRGSCDDFIEEEYIRNIIKCGISIERMSLYLRLGYNLEQASKEIKKMMNRLYKSGLEAQAMSVGTIELYRMDKSEGVSEEELLQAVENLVVL